MSTVRIPVAPSRGVVWLTLLAAIPLAALAALRSVGAIPLDGSSILAWVAPLAATAVALVGATATLRAVMRALDAGSASAVLDAGGLAVLSGTYAMEAFAGAGGAATVPSAASAIGSVLAAVLLLAGAAFATVSVHVARRRDRVLSILALFVVVDLGLGVVALGMANGFRRPEETILRFIAMALLLLAAALGASRGRRAALPAMLAVGTFALAVARIGSVDVLIGLAAITAGMVLYATVSGDEVEVLVDHTRQAAPEGADEMEEPPLLERLTHELQGTIAELIQARRTIELQRAELDRAITTDDLTGVDSRGAILERLRLETAEARRYDHPLALLLLDVDGLRDINREHGLTIGDVVLREIALRLRLRVREADAVGRAGSDGFVLILPHTDERGAAVFADTLRRRIGHREILTDAGALNVTISIGVAIVRPGMDLTDEDVLADAGEALSSAKAAGGDRIAFDRAHGLARIEGGSGARRSMPEAAQDSGA